MAQITNTLNDIQSKVLESLDSLQAPIVGVVKQAAARLDGLLPEDRPDLPEQVPAPGELIDFGFGFAVKLLEDQRDFIKAILDAAAPVLPAHSKPVKVTKAKAAAA